MKSPVTFFEDYEKITDTVMWFNKDITLNFVVSLANKDKNGNRSHFHKEWQYDSKYNNKDKVLSIKRNFGYYLVINMTQDKENSLLIRQQDMMMLKTNLKKVTKFASLFKYDEKHNKLQLSSAYNSIVCPIGRDRVIQFDPIVIIDDEGIKEEREGIRVSLTTSSFFDISFDTFLEFYYIISTFNMYQAAITLLNYLPAEFGKFNNVDSYQKKNNFFDKNK